MLGTVTAGTLQVTGFRGVTDHRSTACVKCHRKEVLIPLELDGHLLLYP